MTMAMAALLDTSEYVDEFNNGGAGVLAVAADDLRRRLRECAERACDDREGA